MIPFSLSKGDQLRGRFPGPASYGSSDYQGQAEELVALSAGAERVGSDAHRHPACGFYGKEAEQCLKLILRR